MIGINEFKIKGEENLGFALESNAIINWVNQQGLNISAVEED